MKLEKQLGFLLLDYLLRIRHPYTCKHHFLNFSSSISKYSQYQHSLERENCSVPQNSYCGLFVHGFNVIHKDGQGVLVVIMASLLYDHKNFLPPIQDSKLCFLNQPPFTVSTFDTPGLRFRLCTKKPPLFFVRSSKTQYYF